MRFHTFGDPDVLRMEEIDKPEPGPGEVRLRVRAAGVNPLDSHIRRGDMQQRFTTPLPSTPGTELAGVVDALGQGTTGFHVGDEVVGWSRPGTGTYAEFALALAEHLVLKPAATPWDVAAALPVAAEAAARVLDGLHLEAGEVLIIHGAGGGVGTIAVQLAVARGVRVLGTASAANQDDIRELGATPLEYGPGLVERAQAVAPEGVDAAFDVAGRGALADSIALTRGAARVVTIADMSAGELGVRFDADGAPSVDRLRAALELHEAGRLTVRVARSFELADAAEAHRVSEGGHARGKLVLLPDADSS